LKRQLYDALLPIVTVAPVSAPGRGLKLYNYSSSERDLSSRPGVRTGARIETASC